MQLHPTAIIADGAKIGEGTVVGPYTVIGPHVVLGKNNKIASHVVIEGHTTLGDENEVFQFASLGSKPQDLKYKGENSVVVIGDRNSIREYVTIQPGTTGGGMITKIGNGNLLMVNSHVGHDSKLGDSNVIANSCAIAGHVTIGNRTILGGLSGVHQFAQVGDYCMIAAGSMVTLDVFPCAIAEGNRARHVGINTIGLQRAGYDAATINAVKKFYRRYFNEKGTLQDRLAVLRQEFVGNPLTDMMIAFLESSQRGVCPLRSKNEPLE